MTNDELWALVEAATPGPWTRDDFGELLASGQGLVYCSSAGDAWFDCNADAEFIAAARTEVPRLLDENAALRTEFPAAETLAQWFHETYERLAPVYHYGTRPESAVPWDDVPTLNKGLMIATAREILARMSPVMTARYTHVASTSQEAADAIDGVFGEVAKEREAK